ncbi:MAG TPA: exosortase H-associated membrane protein, partial [Xanthomonadales bacterium]|nr:exosortase H-associated membrane protein [Xanthomonadales bacterium]
MNQPVPEDQPATEAATADQLKDSKPPVAEEELKLSEMLILASMWMLFGFMLWFYLSAFHGAPARLIAEFVLSDILGDSFRRIIVEPNQNFLFQVETNIQYVFKDGTQEALGFIVNPLVYSYGLP